MKRILCWDKDFIEQSENLCVRMHEPRKREIALVCDDEWEGVHNGYASVMKVGDTYRLYYRAATGRAYADGHMDWGESVICVAESRDGVHFKKPYVGKYEYNGTRFNNVVVMDKEVRDNFSVIYDENPDCPKDERFKALSKNGRVSGQLDYYASEDGYDFRPMGKIDVQGAFDSYNTFCWDENSKQYFLFYRNFHTAEGEITKHTEETDAQIIRDVSVATSKDFKTWTQHGWIRFAEGQEEYQLYTNQIVKYYREKGTFIGFPTRYNNRMSGQASFSQMPLGDRHEMVTKHFGREGTAVTDCIVMTSKDGMHFNRRDEAFLTPGVENRNNWWYGNCYTAYGLVETEADEWGAPNEISLYVGENYRINHVNFRRYTVRLDGFFSWYGNYSGATVLTKPLAIEGDTLALNFSSSALGGVKVVVCNEEGEPIEGYESDELFGDTTERKVPFSKPFSELRGRTVRLKFELKDVNLYSFAVK